MIGNYGISLQNYAAGMQTEKSTVNNPKPPASALDTLKSSSSLSPATTVEPSEKAKSILEQSTATYEAVNKFANSNTINTASAQSADNYSSLRPISFF